MTFLVDGHLENVLRPFCCASFIATPRNKTAESPMNLDVTLTVGITQHISLRKR